jgi:hypothetical protein
VKKVRISFVGVIAEFLPKEHLEETIREYEGLRLLSTIKIIKEDSQRR